MQNSRLQSIIAELTAGLQGILDDQLQEIRLYGSQARGEARSDSDIDVLVVVDAIDDYGNLLEQTSELIAALSLKYDVVISRTFATSTALAETHSPFYRNVRQESIVV